MNRRIFACFVVACSLGCRVSASEPAPSFDWLTGIWLQREENGWTEETWTSMDGGLMLGTNRSFQDGKILSREFLRIETDDLPNYVASPGGRRTVVFRLVSNGAYEAIFENAEHDFPQRITYQRHDDVLHVSISSMDGAKKISWAMRRQ